MSSFHRSRRDSSSEPLERSHSEPDTSNRSRNVLKDPLYRSDSSGQSRRPEIAVRGSVTDVMQSASESRRMEAGEHSELPKSAAIDGLRERKNIHSLSAEEIRQKNEHFDARYEVSLADKGDRIYTVDVSVKRTADHLPRREVVYSNHIDLNKEEIIGGYNFPSYDDGRPNTHSDDLSSRMSLSDIKYQALRFVINELNRISPEHSLDIKNFHPKKLVEHEVEEVNMYREISKVIAEKQQKELTIHRGSEEFERIMKTQPAKSAIFLAENYFPGRQITHLEIKRGTKNKQIASVEYILTPANDAIARSSEEKREVLLE